MEISREELFDRVWETPVTRLAKELDISDVGLAKVCRTNAIPLPPRGYWARRLHGKHDAKPALPASSVKTIRIEASRHRSPKPPKRQQSGCRDSLPEVLVQPPPPVKTPFADATRKYLLSLKQVDGLLQTSGAHCFSCRVSRTGINSACELLSSVERMAPQYGARFVARDKALAFEFEDQQIEFRLLEQYTTTEEPVPGRRYESWQRPPVRHLFSGMFTLEILGYFEGQKKWADGKRQKLMEVLPSFMEGLVFAAQQTKQRRLDMEVQRRRWEDEARRRADIERRQRELEAFRTKLLAELEAQRENTELTHYLDALDADLKNFVGPLSKQASEWLATARMVAAVVEPRMQRLRLLTAGNVTPQYSDTYGLTVAVLPLVGRLE